MSLFRRALLALLVALLITGCAYSRHMNAGDKAYDAGDYEAALVQYEAALRVDPNSREATEKALQAREQLVGVYAEEVQAALVADDVLRAMNAAAKAHERLPEGESTAKLVENVKNATFARAQDLAHERDYANALMLYDSIAQYLPPTAEQARELGQTVKSRWISDLTTGAEAAETAGRKGDAALLYGKLSQLTGDPTHRESRDRLRNEILAEHRFVVRVGGRSSDGLRAILGGLQGYGEGTALQVAQELERGVEPGADVRFTVKRPRFRVDKTQRTEVATYQSGTKQVDNPFYRSRQDDLLREEERLTDAENEVTRLESDVDRYRNAVASEGDTPDVTTGAEQNLYNAQNRLESARRNVSDQRDRVQRAREELAREPQFRDEPVYTDLQFLVTTHTLVAESELQAIVTRHGEKKKETVKVPLARQASDDAHPAQPVANVAEDPLQLPTRADLEAELYTLALAEAQRVVSGEFSRFRAQLLERAVNAPTDDERVDLLAIYIVTNPGDVSGQVAPDIAAFRGIPDPVAVLTP